MKQILKVLLFSSLLSAVAIKADNTSNPIFKTSTGGCCAGCCLGACDGSPFLLPRSQGQDLVRESVGVDQFINRFDMTSPYGIFAVTPGYTRSIKPDNIAQYYFGDQLTVYNTLLIQGSNVSTRNTNAWVADYFGLPSDWSSSVKFSPIIDNFMVDLNFYIGLENFWRGTYFKIHSPLTHTRWNMNMTECKKNRGADTEQDPSYHKGEMSKAELRTADLPKSFMAATQGTTTFGDMKSPMCYGKFPLCSMNRTRLADINATLGWNIFKSDDYNFGLYVDATLPTGTRPSACYLFEPIIGNGRHFELGAGVLASWIFLRSGEYEDRYFNLAFDAKFNHLFSSCQRRSFDFCDKPNSRYMLLEEFGPADGHLTTGQDYIAAYQYTGNLIPAINYTTFNVDAKINLQADIVLKVGYVRENWNFDFGYNLWARTGEKFKCTDCSPCVDEFKYALKGNAWLYGEYYESPGYKSEELSNTNSDATIQSVGVLDNGANGFYDSTPIYTIGSQHQTADQLQISKPPVFVTRADLNMGETPVAVSQKMFFNIDYAWKDQDARWLPFLGIGGSIEVAKGSKKDCTCNCNCNDDTAACCDNNCGSCCNTNNTKYGAISQIGVWLKAGLYFE